MSGFDYDFNESAFWLEPDFVLSDIVSGMVNGMGMPIGITLFVQGMIITGTMVSETEYLASLSSVFSAMAKRSLDKPTKKDLKAIDEAFDFTAFAESTSSPEKSAKASGDGKSGKAAKSIDDNEDDDFDTEDIPAPVRYLHLRDAMILTPQPSIAFSQSILPIMRVRLTAVDGWLLGQAVPYDDLGDEDDDAMDGNGTPKFLH
jgi:hypothetical protein